MARDSPLLVPSRSPAEPRDRAGSCAELAAEAALAARPAVSTPGYLRIIRTTSVMMKPMVIVAHMITCKGIVHASLDRLLFVDIPRG